MILGSMYRYTSPHMQDMLARECREYKLIIFYAWKLSPTFTLYYSEDKYFNSNEEFEEWLLDEFEDMIRDVMCDNCEERLSPIRMHNEGYD